ncbi:MAG: NAD(P)-dependent glycerol-3-phosphate dehydrogenase [SAR324 cluster bacterium]|nr:NAD(P)-dependent glycerol-3-phosphate dehydrogenase [SAR324 cluster bacterium]
MNAQKIGVIGAGAWGTAMAKLQSQNGHEVTIWAYESETAENINQIHCNSTFLPNVPLPKNLRATVDLSELIQTHSILMMAIPSHFTREIAGQMAADIKPDGHLVVLSKGIEQKTLLLMSEVYKEVLPSSITIAVLSGPNFASEVASGMPAAAVLACADANSGKELQHLLSASNYRIYFSSDLIGVQIGGAVKNVLAIAAGVCEGMNLGANARASLICRGLAEMKRLGERLEGNVETFLGLSGMGDLTLTATDRLSRNYSLGISLGEGTALGEHLSKKKSIAEGVKNAASLHELTHRLGIQLPICDAVYEVLYRGLSCSEALHRLMDRDLPECE